MSAALTAHYRALLQQGDPRQRALAARQLARLHRTPAAPTAAPSRWAHVPLDQLFGEAGDTVQRAGGGRLECGHEPVHASRSGRCVRIDPGRGTWYCRSCRRGGDAVSLVMSLRGCSGRAAISWLVSRYGVPGASRPRRRHRLIASVEVQP